MATVLYGGATTEERRRTVEGRIGAGKLVQLFDEDGDGQIAGDDLVLLESFLSQAYDVVTGLLIRKGYNEVQLRDHLSGDRQVVNAWTGVFAQLAGERKPEWLTEGKGQYDAFGSRARAELAALARGETRSHTEAQGGSNAALVGEVGQHLFEFAPDPNIPGDRGKGSF